MIRLHHVPFSRSFRVLWMLEEMNLECEISMYSIRDGSLRASAFRAISPAGRVPALEVDGLRLFESGAILQYLCETRPQLGLSPAVGDPERPRFLELMGFAETMAGLIEQLNMSHLFLRDPSMASPTVIKLNTARLGAAMQALQELLADQDYLLQSGFSAVDAMMGFNLFSAPYYVKLDQFPKLLAYRQQLEVRPGYQRARARDGKQDFYTRSFYPVPVTGPNST